MCNFNRYVTAIEYSDSKEKIAIADKIMFFVNRYPGVKEGLKKDLRKWDGDPGSLYNALLMIRAYPLLKNIYKKVEEYATLKLMDLKQ